MPRGSWGIYGGHSPYTLCREKPGSICHRHIVYRKCRQMDGDQKTKNADRIAPTVVRGRPGMKPRLDDDLIKLICDAKRLGLPSRDIAAFCRVNSESLLSWARMGRQDKEKGRKTVYAQFFEAYEKAEAERLAQSFLRIHQAAKGGHQAQRITTTFTDTDGTQTTTVVEKTAEPQWKADAWMLERTRPDDFAPKSRTELTGKDGGPVEARFGWLDLLNAAEKQEAEKVIESEDHNKETE